MTLPVPVPKAILAVASLVFTSSRVPIRLRVLPDAMSEPDAKSVMEHPAQANEAVILDEASPVNSTPKATLSPAVPVIVSDEITTSVGTL